MNNERKKVRVLPLIVLILLPLLTGGFSALLTAEDMKIYEILDRPFLAPPSWLFPIVWTILYAVMGVASYLVYAEETDSGRKTKAFRVYITQLLMNFFWSTLFFTYARYLLSLIWLLVMWVMILICAVRFYRIKKSAGYMMAALFVWTTFAAYLNLAWYIISLKNVTAAALII